MANDKIHSEFIKGLLEDLHLGDLELVVDKKYHKVIGNYINFLHGRLSEITTLQKLLDCFNMNTYYSDGEYFKYLMKQLLAHWSRDYGDFGSLLDSNNEDDNDDNNAGKKNNNHPKPDPDLEREIELYLPFNLLSDKFKLRQTFVKEWMTIKDNKTVTMDGDSVVINTTIQYNKTRVSAEAEARYSYPWGIDVTSDNSSRLSQYVTIYLFFPDYELESETPCLDKGEEGINENGLVRHWYGEELSVLAVPFDTASTASTAGTTAHRQLKSEVHYVDGVMEGKKLTWWPNGQLQINAYYEDDEPNGLYEEFNWDGKLMSSGEYDMGQNIGEWYEYDEEDDTYSYTDYDVYNPRIVQTYEKFAADGTLLESGKMQTGLKNGKWYELDVDINQAYIRDYVYNDLVDEWPTTPRTSDHQLK